MIRQDLEKFNLPDSPGVYYFLGGKKGRTLKTDSKGPTLGSPRILYIGKATSLRDRVKSYFTRDLLLTRGPLIEKMIEEAGSVKFIKTDSVLEALMLETAEIKRHKPTYNTKEKDDKSYNYVVITKEDYPRILLKRGKELTSPTAGGPPSPKLGEGQGRGLYVFGPFPHGNELKEALKIIRKIFPYRDEKCKGLGAKKPCFNYQIGLCPGPCAGVVSKAEYKKTIRNLKLFFEGNKPKLVQTLEKEMDTLAKKQKFEEAEKVKRTLYALEHIQDVAMIKADMSQRNFGGLTRKRAPTPTEISLASFRIEAYDIAHLGGKETVGVMTVVVDGELDKSQYRKFKIRGTRGKRSDLRNSERSDLEERVKIDDVANLKEVLLRRFNHPEWRYPDLIVVDGGKAQINVAESIQKEFNTKIPVVSVVKDERHKARQILKGQTLSTDPQGLTLGNLEKEILLANAEAHRFAVKYHRKLRQKGFRI